MANKALDELQGLLDMQGEAEDAQANLAKLQGARAEFSPNAPTDSDIWGEAAITAAGIGWVLGPVGGLLTGLAVGILGKQEQQAALDDYNDRVGVLSDTNDIFNDAFDRAALTANEADSRTLSSLQTQKDMAMEMSSSADPGLQQQGAEMLTAAMKGLNDLNVTNDAQQIAADAFDKQMQRDMDKETYNRHRGLLGDFDTRMGDFDASIATADNIIEAINKGDGASVTASLATLPLLVNPSAGATTEGEVEIWQKIGGTIDSLKGRLAKELGGGGLTDPTRKEIIAVAQQWKRNTISSAQAVEADFGERIAAEGIPQNLWSQYNRTGKMRVVQEGGFIRGASHTADSATATAVDAIDETSTSLIDRASMAIGDFVDSRKHDKAHYNEFMRIHGTAPTEENGGLAP